MAKQNRKKGKTTIFKTILHHSEIDTVSFVTVSLLITLIQLFVNCEYRNKSTASSYCRFTEMVHVYLMHIVVIGDIIQYINRTLLVESK